MLLWGLVIFLMTQKNREFNHPKNVGDTWLFKRVKFVNISSVENKRKLRVFQAASKLGIK